MGRRPKGGLARQGQGASRHAGRAREGSQEAHHERTHFAASDPQGRCGPRRGRARPRPPARLAGRAVARGLVLLPYVLPSVASALIWKWIYNDLLGVLNYGLLALSLIDQPIGWLARPELAMPAVIAVAVWKNMPFVVLVVLARLQTIPGEYYEAAAVDGANAWQRFWRITLPQLRTILLIVVLLRFLWVFNEFDTIWLLTQGGPLQATVTLSILAYTRAFVEFKISQGVAVTVCMMLFLAVVSVGYFRAYRVEEEVT
jgi:multiple sugar transport system permease protein